MSRKVLTSPYIIWGAAFIILPLFMVIYYGCTGSDGNFTLSNITAMADPSITKHSGILSGLRWQVQ